MTDDEIKAEYVASMGSDLGSLHHELQNELAALVRKWDDFDALFRDDDAHLEMLNRVASNFFFRLQNLFYEDALLHISRLTDPAVSGRSRQTNLTLMRLPEDIADESLRRIVEDLLESAKAQSRFARKWRDKRLAHSDRSFTSAGAAGSLPRVDRANVRQAIESLCKPIKVLNEHFGHQSLLATLRDPWGVGSLLHHLRVAARASQEP